MSARCFSQSSGEVNSVARDINQDVVGFVLWILSEIDFFPAFLLPAVEIVSVELLGRPSELGAAELDVEPIQIVFDVVGRSAVEAGPVIQRQASRDAQQAVGVECRKV